MYSYTYDPETGGLLLNTTPLVFSNEPRPVYYKELDILGFDKYWSYEKNDAYPYMWAEANNYYYRGKKVARTKGGTISVAPTIEILDQPEPDDEKLRFVDIPAMIAKNELIMEGLVQDTIKKIYKTYNDYKKKIDVFYVAFSGGKDSIVTLDLVQRSLPHNEFLVLFGDTGMEFPDTYETVNNVKEQCEREQIEFLKSKSEFDTDFTWKIFGPPATVTRWCCSVHKTAPQIVALRRKLQKTNFTGLAFIGVRASESLSRNEYDYISLGEKHKGQYSCNPILEWNSAELFIYIYSNDLYLNEAYKKGNRRAGCLVCPRAAERNEYMCSACYPQQTQKYLDLIKDMYSKTFSSSKKLDEFIGNGGWKARKNGRDLDVSMNYVEGIKNGKITIKITDPKQDWKMWIKTIGELLNSHSPYKIFFRGNQYELVVEENQNTIEVFIDENLSRSDTLFVKLVKNVFRKAACCIGCHECEADCHNGCISMVNGRVEISDKCVHCASCHKVEKGCLIYKSLEMPKGGLTMVKTKSLNCYSHFAPRMEWFDQFFKYKEDFDNKHTLGSQMYSFFKRFLRDSLLIDETGYSKTAKIVENLGIDNLSSWGIIFTNLSYTPQINWYVKNINFYEKYGKDYTLSLLVDDGAKESWVADIWNCFVRFSNLPLGDVGFGIGERQAEKYVAVYRTPWQNPDPRVILYSLYRFAEACGGYNQFTLTRLLNHDIESDGVSPTEIFGLSREQMEKIVSGLAINYPEFISASFTLDLDNINLKSDKTSDDVLKLF